jgi:hypothetical protein
VAHSIPNVGNRCAVTHCGYSNLDVEFRTMNIESVKDMIKQGYHIENPTAVLAAIDTVRPIVFQHNDVAFLKSAENAVKFKQIWE